MDRMTEALLKPAETSPAYDIDRIRADFPFLQQKIYGKPLVFLDTAASAQKPLSVIEAIGGAYTNDYANVHRGVYYLSQQSTQAFEDAREKLRAFINAREPREVIFVRGATEGINLVAQSYGRAFLKAGDEVILSAMEHHSNIVPWQMLRDQIGIVIKVAPMDERGNFLLSEYEKLLGPKTRFVAVTQVSNALGTVTPLADIIAKAHAVGARVLVDGCQAVPHAASDMQKLGADFYVFSGHKLYGPTGIGVLYGRAELLEAMPPYQGGGEMISSVTFEKTEYNVIPFKFEAGTPHIVGAIGLGFAVDYLTKVGLANIAAYETGLYTYAIGRIAEVEGLRVVGAADNRSSVISFVMDCAHPHDIGTILDREGVAIRVGHHCAQPVMDFMGVPATARASIGMYNTTQDIDALIAGLYKVRKILA
jgi:cysteine desulfurase/selenocysteine lyase